MYFKIYRVPIGDGRHMWLRLDTGKKQGSQLVYEQWGSFQWQYHDARPADRDSLGATLREVAQQTARDLGIPEFAGDL